jgi:DeoR/GlpR family transcriptional regulator of sugar metabolism
MHVFPAERRQAILDKVRVNGAVSLRELAEAVGTSEVTVRRDVRELEEAGLLDRRRGGVMLPGGLSREPSYSQKTRVASAEKAAIALLAASFIREGDAVLIGAGSTTQALAQRLVRVADLTVVTNSILVAEALAHAPAEVVVTGGSLRGATYALVGSTVEQALAGLHVRAAFISGNGLTAERGLSTPNMMSASVDRAMVTAAETVVVLADHTKLGVDTMFQTVPVDRITDLVSDDEANPDVVAQLRSAGVRVHLTSTSP